MSHPLSHPLLLFLLLVTCHGQNLVPTNSDPLPSVYIPIGVGSSPDPLALAGGFGIFGEYLADPTNQAMKTQFDTCGDKILKSANPQSTTSSAVDIAISCEPSPDRIIIRADGTPVDFGQWPRDLKQECEMLTCSDTGYSAGGQDAGTMDIDVYFKDTSGSAHETQNVKNVKVTSAMPENEERVVCKDKKTQFSNTATGRYLIANEGQCIRTHPGLKAKLDTEAYMQVPRWLQPGQKVRDKRSTFFHTPTYSHVSHRVPFSFNTPSDLDGKQFRDCSTACWHGPVYKYAMYDNMEYQMSITMNINKCEAFRICFGSTNHADDTQIPNCRRGGVIDVNVRSGIVSWPNNARSSLIQFVTPSHQGAKSVIIEFGYGITVNGQQRAEFYFGNMHREIVSSSSAGFRNDDAKLLAFFFPQDDCLVTNAGIFSKGISHGKTLTSMSEDLVKQASVYDPKTQKEMKAAQNEVFTTTTPQPAIIDIPTTVTPPPMRAIPGVANLVNPDSTFESNAASKAIYVEGKWWTWGIYIGFVVGTLLTLGLGSGLFYVLRRTVFGIWYRGMYKRYGCDASGTTGGLTGVGFGNEVTGDQTVQGTTGGTTGASVMGTTGGGGTSTGSTETSTLLDKTGGGTEQKSIAM